MKKFDTKTRFHDENDVPKKNLINKFIFPTKINFRASAEAEARTKNLISDSVLKSVPSPLPQVEEWISNILIIDPAASTGWSVYEIIGESAKFVSSGYFDVDTFSEYQGDWCLDIATKVQKLVEHYSVEEVVIEDFFFSKKYASGSSVNCFYRAAVYAKIRELGLIYHIVGITVWKSFVAGRANPTKEQKREWGALLAKKLFIKEAFERKYGVVFPEKVVSNTTGRLITLRSDIIDSNGQAVYFLKIIKNVTKIDFSGWESFWKSPENIFMVPKKIHKG